MNLIIFALILLNKYKLFQKYRIFWLYIYVLPIKLEEFFGRNLTSLSNKQDFVADLLILLTLVCILSKNSNLYQNNLFCV